MDALPPQVRALPFVQNMRDVGTFGCRDRILPPGEMPAAFLSQSAEMMRKLNQLVETEMEPYLRPSVVRYLAAREREYKEAMGGHVGTGAGTDSEKSDSMKL